MDCRDIQSLITPYIEDKLDDNQLEAFLDHIKACTECQEELEVYFIVDSGLKQLDGKMESGNIKEILRDRLLASQQYIKNKYSILITKYAVITLATLATILMVLLQFRIWLQFGM